MKRPFVVGDLVVRCHGQDNTPYEEMVVTGIDRFGVLAGGKYWTKTGLKLGEKQSSYRARIRHRTQEDAEYFEGRRLAGILRRYP